MNGAATLEDLRRQGVRPTDVFLLDYPPSRLVADWTVARQLDDGSLPQLHIHDDDPATTDVRFLQGVCVHLDSADAFRALAWIEVLLDADVACVVHSNQQGDVAKWPLS